jgi:DNA-directed RNA polymerase II subunit RPB1
MLFTLKDTFLEIDIVMNLLMWIKYDGTIPHPIIIKPKPLWTGKQLFSLIVPDINLQKVGDNKTWASSNDKNVLISKGTLHCGIMTSGTIGKSAGGIIHVIWKEHGPDATRDFLSNV